jgi:RNA polymerase sigma-70 factor (ECF subfamily)
MQNAAPTPDLFLARRASKGDPRAWEELTDLYGEKIYNVCLSFAGGGTDAEDLTQDVFLKLYRQLNQYRGDVPLVAWALRLSRNLCIDHYRHHRIRQQSETVSDEVLRHLAGPDNPQADIQERERRRLVQETLRQMPEDLATVILLRDLQGLAYDEVAAFLELPLGTVKSRLNRARRELVSRLEPRLTGSGHAEGHAEEQVSC